eukprot:3934639-Rhodomonas_salina.1
MARQAKTVAELTAAVERLSRKRRGLEPSSLPDVEEVQPPVETVDEERPSRTARSEGVANIADAFV